MESEFLNPDKALAKGVEPSGYAGAGRTDVAAGEVAFCVAAGDGVTVSIGGLVAIDEKASEPPNQIVEDGRAMIARGTETNTFTNDARRVLL